MFFRVFVLQVILLGDSAVGKSKLVERFLMDDYHPRQVRVMAAVLVLDHEDTVTVATCVRLWGYVRASWFDYTFRGSHVSLTILLVCGAILTSGFEFAVLWYSPRTC